VRSWNRASFEFHTRPVRAPRRVRQRDVLLPAHHSSLRLLAACVACGLAISLLFAWVPLMLVAIMLDDPLEPWFWAIVAGVGMASTVGLFVLASRQMSRYREHAVEG
jgi:hypothetical protein